MIKAAILSSFLALLYSGWVNHIDIHPSEATFDAALA